MPVFWRGVIVGVFLYALFVGPCLRILFDRDVSAFMVRGSRGLWELRDRIGKQ